VCWTGDATALGLPLKNEDGVLAVVLAASGLKLQCLRLISTTSRFTWQGLIPEAGF
jgi:hypothetical protein